MYKKRKHSAEVFERALALHYRGPSKANGMVRPYKKRRFIPGVDRTGGFYGRYARDGELKFHDVDLDDAVIAAGGVVVPSVNLIAQGTTENTRVGRKCTIKGFYWKGTLTLPEIDAVATPPTPDLLRIILYQDKQCNGATATTTGVLETADIDSFRNLANSGRFNILWDHEWALNYNTLASDTDAVVSAGKVNRRFSYYKKLNMPLEFDNITGAITEIRSNNIGVILVSNNGTSGINSKVRLRFSDGS